MADNGDEAPNVIEVLKPLDEGAHEALLKTVEAWLEERREDRREGIPPLVAIAIVVVYSDGSVGSMYDPGDQLFTLLGAITSLQNEMAHK